MPYMSEATQLTVWRGILRYHAKATATVSSRLQSEVGLTLAEFEVLAQRLPMSELARMVVLTASGITRMIDRLVDRNLVERQSVRSDGRVQHAVLSDEGAQLVAKASVVHADAVTAVFGGRLSSAQLAQLFEISAALAHPDPSQRSDS
jgi:DNA-binding MarR family transcriptional regulator